MFRRNESKKRLWSGYSDKLRTNDRLESSKKNRKNKKGKKLTMNLLGNRRKGRKSTKSRATSLSKRQEKYSRISLGRNS